MPRPRNPVANSRRKPLKSTSSNNKQSDEASIWSSMVSIFSESQYVSKSDENVIKIAELYANSDFNVFERLFIRCLKKLLQSKHTDYFEQVCQFICKLLKRISSQNDHGLIRACVEVTNHYMQISDETCRLNSVFLVGKFLANVDFIDERLCSALMNTLSKRIRDKKASIRAHAVLAASKFQDHSHIKDALLFHFDYDPELTVRKALLQTMDPAVFGCDFLVRATQGTHQTIRSTAYQRLAKVSPKSLSTQQLHRVLHNGLFERERSVSYAFKSSMMASWLTKLYDDNDLVKLLRTFDVVNYTEDINRLLEQLHSYDLEQTAQINDEETATKLHKVVINFQEKWLDSRRLPDVENLDERVIIVWTSLIKFCKEKQVIIKTIKDPASQNPSEKPDPNESIENIINSQEQNQETVPLYELLMPDLIHLMEYLQIFIRYTHERVSQGKPKERYEFIYKNLTDFMGTYKIGDESEIRVIRKVIGTILEENLLIMHFSSFLKPIIKYLRIWVFPTNQDQFIRYIAELINNIRSHLEDEQHDAGDADVPIVFKGRPQELLKCLQLYHGCLENVKLTELPTIMKSHFNYLSINVLDQEPFQKDIYVWWIACNGISAFMDKSFACEPTTMTLLIASCNDRRSKYIQARSFDALVDATIQHDDLDVPCKKLELFLNTVLSDYDCYASDELEKEEFEFVDSIVRGTLKLYYFKKLSSPEALAHLTMWWYIPETNSLIKQCIGVFLPLLVKGLSTRQPLEENQSWLEELLSKLFVKSIEFMHLVISGPDPGDLDTYDMECLVRFLCNLVPPTFHAKLIEFVDEYIDDIRRTRPELAKYIKKAKEGLNYSPEKNP